MLDQGFDSSIRLHHLTIFLYADGAKSYELVGYQVCTSLTLLSSLTGLGGEINRQQVESIPASRVTLPAIFHHAATSLPELGFGGGIQPLVQFTQCLTKLSGDIYRQKVESIPASQVTLQAILHHSIRLHLRYSIA